MSEKLALPKHLLRSQNLYDIFHFYSKLIYTHGVNNDFDRINYESNVLTMGKFFIFCRQFGIIEENRHIDFIRNKNLKNVSESLEKEK